MDLIFAFLVGIAPKSALAIFVVETFGDRWTGIGGFAGWRCFYLVRLR
jgi:hypothetical protein